MHRVGLALSGGGFRATVYHLGVIRYLRDIQVLPKITHITTVSGGSVLGAHLALNWDRYCGSESEFEQAASEIVRFVQLDVRNRIVRRFPFTSTVNCIGRWLRLGNSRRLTRPGLLEKHYEQFLYGDVALSELPEQPNLHILSTNLSEGCLCSFNSKGLILQRRRAGKRDHFESVKLGLATVPMAVTASSAFPGFFPPLELSGWDVGASEGEFDRQAFTDGGVYDNLGLRMFRCIEQSWVHDVVPLRKKDFLELDATVAALQTADSLPEQTPLYRLRQMLDAYQSNESPHPSSDTNWTETMIAGLWEIIRSERLYRDPSLQGIELTDPSADSLLHYVRTSTHELELSDRLWLNRQIVESALSQVVGKPCLRAGKDGFDAILVSDAGGKFKVASDGRAGGLVKTALRSSDILMNRVWQLEKEAFESTPRVLFFPISRVVNQAKDRWAPNPEIQRQTARIRTDLDRFSKLEISALVQHGYCVARRVMHESELFQNTKPTGIPWDPFLSTADSGRTQTPCVNPLNQPSKSLSIARKLQHSSVRRTWSTLFSWRDWPTYLWLPILALIAFGIPYWLYKANLQVRQQQMVLSAIAETSTVYDKVLRLLKDGPQESIDLLPFVEVNTMEEPDYTGFEVLLDSRVFDLRHWSGRKNGANRPIVHGRTRIRRTSDVTENTKLRLQLPTKEDKPFMSCRTESLSPVVSRMKNDGGYKWEIAYDFDNIPIGGNAEIFLDAFIVSDVAEETSDGGNVRFSIPFETGVVEIWMLLPENRPFKQLEMVKYPSDKPHMTQLVVPDTRVEMAFGSIATFRFIKPEKDNRYEFHWKWSNPASSD